MAPSIRSVLVAALVCVGTAGCVSIGPGETQLPTPGRPGITTPAPIRTATQATALPTAPLAPTPTLEPTLAPTLSAPPTPVASIVAIEDFGADALVFADAFDDSSSGWGVGSTPGGDVDYVDGALQFDTSAAGSWMWSRRTFDAFQNVVHLEAAFIPSAAGYQGLLCANNDDHLFGGVVTDTGRWVFMELTAKGANVLSTSEEDGWAIAPNVATRIALDCAGTVTGSLRMQLSLPDLGLARMYEADVFLDAEPPDSFDRVGLYAEASGDPFSVRVDDFFVYGGTGDGV